MVPWKLCIWAAGAVSRPPQPALRSLVITGRRAWSWHRPPTHFHLPRALIHSWPLVVPVQLHDDSRGLNPEAEGEAEKGPVWLCDCGGSISAAHGCLRWVWNGGQPVRGTHWYLGMNISRFWILDRSCLNHCLPLLRSARSSSLLLKQWPGPSEGSLEVVAARTARGWNPCFPELWAVQAEEVALVGGWPRQAEGCFSCSGPGALGVGPAPRGPESPGNKSGVGGGDGGEVGLSPCCAEESLPGGWRLGVCPWRGPVSACQAQ